MHFWVKGLGFRVWGWGLGFRVWGLGLRFKVSACQLASQPPQAKLLAGKLPGSADCCTGTSSAMSKTLSPDS